MTSSRWYKMYGFYYCFLFYGGYHIYHVEAGRNNAGKAMTDYKRQWRELSDEHREKISQATVGRPKSAEHRQHISQAMTDYWQTVPHRPDAESGGTTMKDLIGA